MTKKRKPSYLLHKGSGQARVRLDGQDFYLGPYGSQESYDRYDDLLREWLLKQDPNEYRLTIDDLALMYFEYAESYYIKDGQPTREVSNIRSALRPLIEMYGTTPVREFSVKKLRRVRDSLIGKPDARPKFDQSRQLSRRYINRLAGKIVRMFRWAVSEELVPVHIHQQLMTLDPLKKGRTTARETRVSVASEGVLRGGSV